MTDKAIEFIEKCSLSRVNSRGERKFLKHQWKLIYGKYPPISMTDTELRAKIYAYLSGKDESKILNDRVVKILIKSEYKGDKQKKEVEIEVKNTIKDICIYKNGYCQTSKEIKLVDGMIFPDGNYPIYKIKVDIKDMVYVFTKDGNCQKLDNIDGDIVSVVVNGNVLDISDNGYVRKTSKIVVGKYSDKKLLNVIPYTDKILGITKEKLEIVECNKIKEGKNKKLFSDDIERCCNYYDDSYILILDENGKIQIRKMFDKIKEVIFCNCIETYENLIMITDKFVLKKINISNLPIDKKVNVKLNNEKIIHVFME